MPEVSKVFINKQKAFINVTGSSLVKKPRVSDPVQATDQEVRIIEKIRELGLQFEGVGSNAELELIHQTFLSLHDIDKGRRNI